MEHVYLVIGRTYENLYEWQVGAFVDENSCFNYVNKLNQLLIENDIHEYRSKRTKEPSQDFLDTIRTLDPNFERVFINRGWQYAEYDYSMHKVPMLTTEN